MINKQKQSRRDALKMGVAAITVAGTAAISSAASAQTKVHLQLNQLLFQLLIAKIYFRCEGFIVSVEIMQRTQEKWGQTQQENLLSFSKTNRCYSKCKTWYSG